MNPSLVALIVSLVVTSGAVVYLVIARREEQRRTAELQLAYKETLIKLIKSASKVQGKESAVAAKKMDELKSLDHETRTQSAVERAKKLWPEE